MTEIIDYLQEQARAKLTEGNTDWAREIVTTIGYIALELGDPLDKMIADMYVEDE